VPCPGSGKHVAERRHRKYRNIITSEAVFAGARVPVGPWPDREGRLSAGTSGWGCGGHDQRFPAGMASAHAAASAPMLPEANIGGRVQPHVGLSWPMPKFFFDIRDGEHDMRDEEGTELTDRKAARKEALAVLPDIARDKSPDRDRRDFIVDVRDETDRLVFTPPCPWWRTGSTRRRGQSRSTGGWRRVGRSRGSCCSYGRNSGDAAAFLQAVDAALDAVAQRGERPLDGVPDASVTPGGKPRLPPPRLWTCWRMASAGAPGSSCSIRATGRARGCPCARPGRWRPAQGGDRQPGGRGAGACLAGALRRRAAQPRLRPPPLQQGVLSVRVGGAGDRIPRLLPPTPSILRPTCVHYGGAVPA